MEDQIKKQLYSLIQSYAVAFKSEDANLVKLSGQALTNYIEELDLKEKDAPVKEETVNVPVES